MYLTRKHFLYMLGMATLLHLTAAIGWMLSPGLTVNQVPVHVLNIKLGSGDMLAQREAPKKVEREETTTSQVVARQEEYVPPPREDSRVETAKVEAVTDKTAAPQPKPTSQTSKQAAKREGNSSEATSSAKLGVQKAVPQATADASQYVRRTGDRAGRGTGSAIGNTAKNAEEVMNRYTQLISMWIQRHKVYPEALRSKRIQGKALIRIRIDRLGNILLYKLDQSTGSLQLDEAVAQMIRAANPVPPVPVDYPGGNVIEFLIPVSYKMQ